MKSIPVKMLTGGKITVPKNIREELNIQEGEILKITKEGEKFVIEKY